MTWTGAVPAQGTGPLKVQGYPADEGFYMPAEFSPHEATIMIFPVRPGSWPHGAIRAQEVFARIIREIARSEKVYVIVDERTHDSAERLLADTGNVGLVSIPSDDAWARDTAPTFVTDGKEVRGINWEFNAWGGDYNGLYPSWDKDNALAGMFCRKAGIRMYDAAPFVLEGGSIHSNGTDTLLVTEECLLSPGRNPGLKKDEIEDILLAYTGMKRLVWLPYGIYNDETDGHVDNIAAFTGINDVVLAWTEDMDDPQYARSHEDLTVLLEAGFRVCKLPIPDHPVCIREEDLEGYEFEDGEDLREVGERLAASYVNFYFTNDSVLLPKFGGENQDSDRRTVDIMSSQCPDRRIVPVPARDIILGGGNIHCITQQIPLSASKITGKQGHLKPMNRMEKRYE